MAVFTSRDRRFPWEIALAAWTALVFLTAAVLSFQVGLPFRHSLQNYAVKYGALGMLGVPVWYCSDAIARRAWSWTGRAALHVGMGVLVLAAANAIHLGHLRLTLGPHFWGVLSQSWSFQLLSDATVYCAMLGATVAVQANRRARAQMQREAELRILAREAELGALRAQLRPHFLLNTLNSILSLMDVSPREARAMLTHLAHVLQAAFDEMEETLVPLERELRLLDAYLAIEKIRFGERLSASVDVAEAARQAWVPPFLLQPLVENAVKHGVAPFTRPGGVWVTGRVEGSRLTLEVADSGPGMEDGDGATGRGLSLTRRILRSTYGPASDLSFDRRDARFIVRLDLPLTPTP
jgi:two-component system, LytTR family, sensor kinase